MLYDLLVSLLDNSFKITRKPIDGSDPIQQSVLCLNERFYVVVKLYLISTVSIINLI